MSKFISLKNTPISLFNVSLLFKPSIILFVFEYLLISTFNVL